MSQSGHFLNRTIWVVSLVSMFTDMAGEMLYPILPLFFQQMGYSGVWAGMIESVADAVSGFSKPYFGRWSDRIQQRKPFIQIGYTLSALAKPAMVFFSALPALAFLRSADRLGKG
ncbi:MAG: MFS transporter, partial [Chitinophagaceae bacterium]|nr:MFS transporter [Chitinophagaceae bacterium]